MSAPRGTSCPSLSIISFDEIAKPHQTRVFDLHGGMKLQLLRQSETNVDTRISALFRSFDITDCDTDALISNFAEPSSRLQYLGMLAIT